MSSCSPEMPSKLTIKTTVSHVLGDLHALFGSRGSPLEIGPPSPWSLAANLCHIFLLRYTYLLPTFYKALVTVLIFCFIEYLRKIVQKLVLIHIALPLSCPVYKMGNAWSQLFPPAPTLTEKNLPDQAGKVRTLVFIAAYCVDIDARSSS